MIIFDFILQKSVQVVGFQILDIALVIFALLDRTK